MKLAYDYAKSLILIDPEVSKELFLSETGAQHGFSRDMFSRMYDAIFSELINLDEEFDKYYSFEYETLEYYLFKRYNLTEKEIDQLVNARQKNPTCNLYRQNDFAHGDYGIIQFAFSETLNERTMNLLMRKKNEN